MAQCSQNTERFIEQYWEYFKTLQGDFLATERYVSIDEDNFETFSVEYNRLYQAICSEIDVIAKQFCKLLGDLNADKISHYCQTITSHCRTFVDEEICINIGHSFRIKPWDKWKSYSRDKSDNPEWWTLYNKVKHNRQSFCTDRNSKWNNKPYYKCATQQNVLFSLAGLFALEFYCLLLICKQDCVATDHEANSIYNSMLPLFSSKLFNMSSWYGCQLGFIGEYIDKNIIEKEIVKHRITI